MVKRRHIAAVPGFVFGAAPFQQDVRGQLMYFGLAGEELGFWRGIVLCVALGLIAWAFWPEIRKWILGRRNDTTESSAAPSIILSDNATYNVVKGDQHIHHHIEGPAVVRQPKSTPLRVEFASGIAVVEATATVLEGPDGKVKDRRTSDG